MPERDFFKKTKSFFFSFSNVHITSARQEQAKIALCRTLSASVFVVDWTRNTYPMFFSCSSSLNLSHGRLDAIWYFRVCLLVCTHNPKKKNTLATEGSSQKKEKKTKAVAFFFSAGWMDDRIMKLKPSPVTRKKPALCMLMWCCCCRSVHPYKKQDILFPPFCNF